MNYEKAFDILEIDETHIKYHDLTLIYLKKQYKKMALKHHPDKNGNTVESTERFKKINDAYQYLKKKIEILRPNDFTYENIENNRDRDRDRDRENCGLNDMDDIEDDIEDDIDDELGYLSLLKNFVKSFFENKNQDVQAKIVNEILIAGKKISLKMFEGLDKQVVFNIFNFLSKYRFVLHISADMLDSIRNIIDTKYDNVDIYKLNPSIHDLLNCHLYKLYIEEKLYLVPLWHYESCYDGSGCEIIVICEPELPEGMKIDEENNLYVEKKINIYELPDMIVQNKEISINVGEKVLYIPLSNLFLKREQLYKIKNEGVPKIKKNIYDTEEKSDIIVKLLFVNT